MSSRRRSKRSRSVEGSLCSICGEKLPSPLHYDAEGFEDAVLQHMLKCSSKHRDLSPPAVDESTSEHPTAEAQAEDMSLGERLAVHDASTVAWGMKNDESDGGAQSTDANVAGPLHKLPTEEHVALKNPTMHSVAPTITIAVEDNSSKHVAGPLHKLPAEGNVARKSPAVSSFAPWTTTAVMDNSSNQEALAFNKVTRRPPSLSLLPPSDTDLLKRSSGTLDAPTATANLNGISKAHKQSPLFETPLPRLPAQMTERTLTFSSPPLLPQESDVPKRSSGSLDAPTAVATLNGVSKAQLPAQKISATGKDRAKQNMSKNGTSIGNRRSDDSLTGSVVVSQPIARQPDVSKPHSVMSCEMISSTTKNNLPKEEIVSLKNGVVSKEVPLHLLAKKSARPVNKMSCDTATASTTKDDLSSEKSLPLVVSPTHFLAQTWWQPKSMKRKSAGVSIPFNLEHCITIKEKVPERASRKSKRLRAQKCTEETLEYSCPLCKKSFTNEGILTEEEMRAHVERCSAKFMLRGGGPATEKSQKSETKLLKQDLAFVSALLRPRHGERDEVRKKLEHRKAHAAAWAKRRKKMKFLLSGPGRRAMDEIILGIEPDQASMKKKAK